MRKFLVIAVFAFVTVAMLAPPVLAQAPAPKVTITGLFDQVTSFGRNYNDADFTRNNDTEWYARTRFRPDFTFEVGRTKAVMGFELDLSWGQTGAESGGGGKGTGAAASAGHPGVTSSSSLNTDVTGIIEIKWIYTEFDLTGKDSLLPFIPVPSVARAGLQPFGALTDMTKVAYATGDFPGFSAVTTFAPNLKTNVAYVMVEDALGGLRRDQTRGEDFAVIFTVDYTVYKGLDIKPIYSLYYAEGVTNANARRNATDPHLAGGTTNAAGTWGGGPNPAGRPAFHENRHTIGFDASWRMGPWGLDPTILYQWGTRDVLDVNAQKRETKMSSFLFDAIGSFQYGPLLLEVRGAYTPGNKARDNLARRIRYFEPLDTDTGYYSSWAAILALSNADFGTGLSAGTGDMPTHVGYDRYGRGQLGFRATYNITPALNVFGTLSPTWTAEKVDTDSGSAAGTRTLLAGSPTFGKGDSSYIGTETNIGLVWKFAPNVSLDLIGAWLASGDALNTTEIVGGVATKRDSKDAYTVSSRVRLAF